MVSGMELRPYQKEVLDLIKENKRVLIIWRPGAGKTWFTAYLVCNSKQLLNINPPHLIVTPTLALHKTWKQYLNQFCESLSGINLTTYQSVAVSPHKYDRDWGLIIADEAHHLPAEKYRTLITLRFKRFIMVTATPFRADISSTRYIYGVADVVHEVPWIAEETENVDIVAIIQRTDEKKKEILKFLVDHILMKPTIVYTEYIRDCVEVSRILGTRCVSGATAEKLGIRGKKVSAWLTTIFKNFLYKEPYVVVMTRVGEEGLDIPNLRSVVEYGWLGSSWRQILQRMGRLLHTEGGKYVIIATYSDYKTILDRLEALKRKGYKVKIIKG